MQTSWRILVVAALAILLALHGITDDSGRHASRAGEPVAEVSDEDGGRKKETGWKQVLAQRLPLYGHRNWIVIADSAYPAQTRPGIETVATNAGQLEVVESVLATLDKARHVRANVLLDAELPAIEEDDARGISRYRTQLKRLLGRRSTQSLPHEQIIDKLDTAAAKFQVLILKTDMTLPYTSVFLELDCGYWGEAAEKRLREGLKKAPE